MLQKCNIENNIGRNYLRNGTRGRHMWLTVYSRLDAIRQLRVDRVDRVDTFRFLLFVPFLKKKG